LRADFRLPDGSVKRINDVGFCVINGIDPDEIFLQREDGAIIDASLSSGLGKIKQAFTGELAEDVAISRELALGISNSYFSSGGANYELVKIVPMIDRKEAKRRALLEITRHNTQEFRYTTKNGHMTSKVYVPRNDEIVLNDTRPIFVPLWELGFSSSGRIHARRMLAGSGTMLEDTITVCPNHLLKSLVKIQRKTTSAVCDVCGDALCDKHIVQCSMCGKWLCDNHNVQCSSCGQRYCNEHLSVACNICNQLICHTCSNPCQICGRLICEKHRTICSVCTRVTCSICSTTRGAFMKKKSVCRSCEQFSK